ncbi:MAG: hypothetical protein PHY42_05225, partial [Bacilli bacterium]|nr:hypothetical protein [Bacilli bacterium]
IYNSYNGGNITIKNYTNSTKTTLLSSTTVGVKTNTLQYMLYIGGIAFKNANTTDIEPVANVIIASSRKGGIHNVLNDGNIHVDVNLYGVSRLGGITVINNGLISSSFNTGNIHNNVAIDIIPSTDDMGNNQFEVEAGGITNMIGAGTGQIMDCANYGDISCVSFHTGGKAWLNSGGIVGRNEKREDNTGNASGNWQGKIQFSINYGNIYAWNAYTEAFGEFLNGFTTTPKVGAESSCKAAGIMAIGVINVINCANYGNSYSRYLAGGIFGLVDGTKFTSITANIYIANSINYGEIRPITAYSYSQTPTRAQFTISSSVPSAKTVNVSGVNYTINSMYGGAIGYIYAHSSWSRDGLNPGATGSTWSEANVPMLSWLYISFLINFDEQVNIIGSQSLHASTSPLAENYELKYSNMVRYMATTKTTDNSMYPFNSYYYNTSTKVTANYNSVEYGIPEYALSSSTGGIFAPDFPLRGGNLDSSIITNDYIRNYISFVDYQYTNQILTDRIFASGERIGLYAVASSKGILNGKYLPDNIYWGTATDLGIDPVENGVVDTSWRGLESDTSSINYKFKSGMKQLAKSIATTVYDLALINVDDPSVHIDAPMIDNENKIITFYVGDNEGKELDGSIVNSQTTSGSPQVDTGNKTITYRDGSNNVIAIYSYATGSLVRMDDLDTYITYNPQDVSLVYLDMYTYTRVDSYTAPITNYYVTKDGGTTYQAATNLDRIFTIAESGSRYWSRTLVGGYYTYTYVGYGSYRVTATEVTNRQLGTNYYYSTTSSNPSYYNYIGFGQYNNIPSGYVLYSRSTSSIPVAYPNELSTGSRQNYSYYESWYTINKTLGAYTLSEGASLNLSTDTEDNEACGNIRIGIPSITNDIYTSSIGTVGVASYLYVYSEAGTFTPYEIRIIRNQAKELSDVIVEVNGSPAGSNSSGSITLSNLNKTSAQEILINYTTINMPDKQNLMLTSSFEKYNAELSHYETYSPLGSQGETLYTLTGGLVVNKTTVFNEMTGEYESQTPDENGVFPDGSTSFQINFNETIAAGTYRLYIGIGTTGYYVQFIVNSSSSATVTALEYDDTFVGESGSWTNSGVTALLTTIKYDAQITSAVSAMATTTPMNWNNIVLPETGYLQLLEISPYASIQSITYQVSLATTYASTITTLGGDNYTSDTNGSRIYIITYNLQAENGTTRTFIHYFVEEIVDTSIQFVYMDGINQGQISELSFVRTNEPVVKVYYNFSDIELENATGFNITIGYTYDTTRYPKPVGGGENQEILDSILSLEGSENGFTITFVNDVAASYTFTVDYTRVGESTPVITFDVFTINKTNNTDSLLVRVLFNTITPFTSLGTIIYNGHQIGTEANPSTYVPETTVTTNQALLTPNIYSILNADANLRVIKSMPNMIYYNDETPRVLIDASNPTIIYNRYDVVGFVSKTDLSNFTPTFSLPTGAVIYQLDASNNPILDVNDAPILSANFVSDGNAEEFEYIHYRIYSEASPVDVNGFSIPNAQCDNYTDYYIYIVDVSYNVYFTVNFYFAEGSDFTLFSESEEKLLLSIKRYEEIVEGETSYPASDISILSNLFYFFKVVGEANEITSYNHFMSATASGYISLDLTLPLEYSFSFDFSGDIVYHEYESTEYFYVPSKVFSSRYILNIYIFERDNRPWGQNGYVNFSNFYE